MKCNQVRKKLSAFVDEQLNPREREEILTHLNQCAGCVSELEILKKTWDSLSVWERIKTAEDFELKFWERIKFEEKKKPSLITTLRDFGKLPSARAQGEGSPDKWKELFRIPLPVPVAVTALILLGIFGGIYLNRILQSQQNEATVSTLSNLYSLNGYSTESLNEILLTGGSQ